MKNKIILTLAFSFLFLSDMLAQFPPLPNDDANVDDVPIHFLVYPLLMLGAYLGFKVLKKK